MRHLYIWALFFFSSTIVLSGCNNNTDRVMNDSAHLLFEESAMLYKKYIDSLQKASDSITIYRLINDFDNRITKINYTYPPDTDLSMKIEDNDSLIKLAKKLEAIRTERLVVLDIKDEPDISNDSGSQ